jgi:uncharacterized protein
MKLDIKGDEEIRATQQQLWDALNDPEVLTLCMPGCKSMTEIGENNYTVDLQLKVGAVGGGFGGEINLVDKNEPDHCRIVVSGGGTLGTGSGNAIFRITPTSEEEVCLLSYEGEGEVGGLVAGVGQRILGSVSKHLIKTFFKELRKYFTEPVTEITI